MADVFISFIHEEERVAGAVQDVLRQILNKEVFISADEWLVYAGEIWLDRIKAELAQAKAVVLMLSEESVKRPWINFEAGAAWLAGKPVIPACFRGLSRNALPKPYSSIQAVDLPNGLYYLVRSVSHHVEPTALLPAPFSKKSFAYRSVAAAIDARFYAPRKPAENWTDDIQDEDFHSFNPNEPPGPNNKG